MSMKMKFGSKDIPFVYKGDKLVYPNPIKDGLLLWYDFKGMRNTDETKGIAKDLSGNGNDGTLTNFNFTEESGYKDNTLVFDGVDDSLTIPELVLDETAMTVMHDGKVYSYEDDKVLTVGEDGEIAGSGKNLYSLSNVSGGSLTIPVKPNTNYTVSSNAPAPNVPAETAIYFNGLTYSVNGVWENNPRTFNSGSNTEMFVRVYTPRPYTHEILNGEYWIMWEEAESESLWSPSPSDYTPTTLTPTSLTDLQLYNKTLNKTELLHNAESKGLKQLKPGVVVQDGLMLHYDFSHESNNSEYKSKAFDYSGNGNHGELQNFEYTEGSGYDEGLTFDGVDDAIQSIGLWEDTGKVTVEAVVKKLPTGTNGAVIGATNRNFELLLYRDATVVAYYSDGTNANYRQHQFTLRKLTEKVNYLAAVFHKDLDKVELYADGVKITERTDPANANLTGFEPSDTIKVGHRNSTHRLQAELYSTRIYKKALTPEEITHNYEIEKEKFNIVEGDV